MADSSNPRLRTLVDAMAQADEKTRIDRARRLIELEEAMPENDQHPWGRLGWLTSSPTGHVSDIFLHDAMRSFRDGYFAAALVCAHAVCEHELVGWLLHTRGPNLPKGWERWGLGRLLGHAASEHWFSQGSQALLEDVNRKRRAFYHYRDLWDEDAVVARSVASGRLYYKDVADEAIRETLHEDALQALRAALVVRTELS